MIPIRHSWFIWILYYNVLNCVCVCLSSPSHPSLLEPEKKGELIKHWRKNKEAKCHFHTHTHTHTHTRTHTHTHTQTRTVCFHHHLLGTSNFLFYSFSWSHFIYKAQARCVTCTLETQTQGRGIIRGMQVSSQVECKILGVGDGRGG